MRVGALLLALALAGCAKGVTPTAAVAPEQMTARAAGAMVMKLSTGGRGRPVLLVHGRNGSSGNFQVMGKKLVDAGHRVYTLDMPDTKADPATWLKPLREAVAATLDNARSPELDLVAHSMGGLLGRAYLGTPEGKQQVRRLVMLASPHRGSKLAFLLGDPAAVQMRPESEFLEGLNASVAPDVLGRCVNIFTGTDTRIYPPSNAHLDGARKNVMLWGPGHATILRDDTAIAHVLAALKP